MKSQFKYLLGFLLVFQWSCSREDDFQMHVEMADDASFFVNSVTSLIEYSDDVMSYDLAVGNTKTTLLPAKARLNFYDSIFWDWDGVNCIFDFNNDPSRAIHCKDGRLRSGRFRVNMRYTYKNKDNRISIVINNTDNFFVYRGEERWRVSGKILLDRQDQYTWFYQSQGWRYENNGEVVKMEIAGYLNKWDDGLPGLEDDNFEITATGAIQSDLDFRFFTNADEPLKKFFSAGCFEDFNLGKMYIRDQGGEESVINYDPFNDMTCDSYAKLKMGSKEDLFEIP
jgi:hypothetical protein